MKIAFIVFICRFVVFSAHIHFFAANAMIEWVSEDKPHLVDFVDFFEMFNGSNSAGMNNFVV